MDKYNIRCSVAMATYNGEKYIKEQIESILNNMTENDELIISDDGSTDNTIQIIKKYQSQDERIKLIEGPKKGVKQNFANAIENTKGKYIFLSDQDDIWMEDKMNKILKKFKDGYTVITHDANVINENKEKIINSFFEYRKSGKGIIKNIWKNTYIGCCMAFDSNIKKYILPIPNNIEMHDQWIGIIGEIKGKNALIFDDEVDTAGSIMETVRILKKAGAKDIYVGCTHGILSGPAIERIKKSDLKELVMTNTVPLPSNKKIDKIVVVSMSELFGEAIKRINEATSIGELFE